MGKIEKLAGPGRLRKAKTPRDWKALALVCLFTLLLPSLRELSLTLPGRSGDLRELRRDAGAASDVAWLCLPAALLCIARLLTEGARQGREQTADWRRRGNTPGVGRLSLLAAVLGLVFVVLCVLLLFPVWIFVYAFEMKVPALLITWGAGYGSALGVSALLLRRWGFGVEEPTPERRIAAGAFGFILACLLLAICLAAPLIAG